MMLPDSIARIIVAGGGVIVDGSKTLPDTLTSFAMKAKNAGTMLIIKNANKMLPDTATGIATSGKGHVIFDLSSD